MADPAELRRRAGVWRYYQGWATGRRTVFRWSECPPDVRYQSGLFSSWSNVEYRHPFLYQWGLWTFVFTVGMVTVPLVPIAPLLAAWHTFRTPRYVKVGARAEWTAYRRQQRAEVQQARRELAAERTVDKSGYPRSVRAE